VSLSDSEGSGIPGSPWAIGTLPAFYPVSVSASDCKVLEASRQCYVLAHSLLTLLPTCRPCLIPGRRRFWKACREAVALFLKGGAGPLDLSEPFKVRVARDQGHVLAADDATFRETLVQFTQAGTGGRVELRRWMTWCLGRSPSDLCRSCKLQC
jgi:hypothetical protein